MRQWIYTAATGIAVTCTGAISLASAMPINPAIDGESAVLPAIPGWRGWHPRRHHGHSYYRSGRSHVGGRASLAPQIPPCEQRDLSRSMTTRCQIASVVTPGTNAALTAMDQLWHNQRRMAHVQRGNDWGTMKNGLYSVHIDLLDGRSGKGSGVVIFRDGKILGGDAYLFYIGSYTVSGSTFKGEVQVNQHTPSTIESPLFGGQSEPVGIGVTGSFTDTEGVMNGTALVGKASQIFRATLRRLADAD